MDDLQQQLMTRFYSEVAKRAPNVALNPTPQRIMVNVERFAFEAAVNAMIAWLSIAAVAESVRQADRS